MAKSASSRPAAGQKVQAGPSGKMNPGRKVATQKPFGSANTNPAVSNRSKYAKR